MNTVAQKHQSLKKSVIIASVAIIIGLLLAGTPYIAKIPMQWTGFILFALGSILAPLIAASVPTDPENNILEITREFQCPDPLSKVIYRIEDIG